jgi:transcriptional regulator with XRE-family HTH domain
MQAAVFERAARRGSRPELVVWTSLWSARLPDMTGEQEQRDNFAYALREAMDYREVSARALAQRLGLDPRRIAAWREGRALPDIFESQRLAAALGVSEELFRRPPAAPPPPPKPYYPLDRYLVEAADSGAAEGHRRASTPQQPGGPGTPARTPAQRARGA